MLEGCPGHLQILESMFYHPLSCNSAFRKRFCLFPLIYPWLLIHHTGTLLLHWQTAAWGVWSTQTGDNVPAVQAQALLGYFLPSFTGGHGLPPTITQAFSLTNRAAGLYGPWEVFELHYPLNQREKTLHIKNFQISIPNYLPEPGMILSNLNI